MINSWNRCCGDGRIASTHHRNNVFASNKERGAVTPYARAYPSLKTRKHDPTMGSARGRPQNPNQRGH